MQKRREETLECKEEGGMSEAKRYFATDVPVVWDREGAGRVQAVVLASDYDALREKAIRLREALCNERLIEEDMSCAGDNYECSTCSLLRDTADPVEKEVSDDPS
jgi:hypothetical protein